MTVVDFPKRPFPLKVVSKSRNSSFSVTLRSFAQFPVLVVDPEVQTVDFLGVASDDEAPECVATTLSEIIRTLDGCLDPKGKRVLDYELTERNGSLDLFVLLEES